MTISAKIKQKGQAKPVQTLLDYKGHLKGRAKQADFDDVREIARKDIGKKASKRGH